MVDARAQAYETQGLLAIPEEWRPSQRVPVPPVFKLLRDAYEGEWAGPRLDSIAKALKAMAAEGEPTGLRGSELKTHRPAMKKIKGAPRWKSWSALFGVAALLRRRLGE
eukprot:638336-Prymnesium_polylepis.1